MSDFKFPPPRPEPTSEQPPPSYDESVTASQSGNSIASRVLALIKNKILPNLHSKPITIIALIPPDVSTLSPPPTPSHITYKTAPHFVGEMLVGFRSDEHPIIVRLTGADDSIKFWQKPATLQELHSRLSEVLGDKGYVIDMDSFTYHLPGSNRSPDWRMSEPEPLSPGLAKVSVGVTELCLRIENDLGLYETRTGKGIVVRIELGLKYLELCPDI